MKPFNLEEAKAGKPVCTRDGRKARILCFDFKNKHFEIVAAISLNENDEYIETFTIDGKKYDNPIDEDDSDLMMAPEKKQGWVNLYRESYGGLYTSDVYFTQETALKSKSDNDKYIDTIPLEWEE